MKKEEFIRRYGWSKYEVISMEEHINEIAMR